MKRKGSGKAQVTFALRLLQCFQIYGIYFRSPPNISAPTPQVY